MFLRLLIHQPGMVYLDGDTLVDLTVGRRPVPWRDYVIRMTTVQGGRPHRLQFRPVDPLFLPPYEEVAFSGEAMDTLTVHLGGIRVTTSPPSARVLVGGQEVGTTPTSIAPNDLWGSPVLIDREGYQRVTIKGDSLLARGRATGSVRLELEPLEGGSSAPPPAHREPYWVRHKTLALGASVTILGAGVYTALRFKDRADRRYDEYLRTGNREQQRNLFDEAVRFDRLSLIGWVVGEAAFLATFFLIIHEEPRTLVPTLGMTVEPGSADTGWQVGIRRAF
jgi:hypothetical protein